MHVINSDKLDVFSPCYVNKPGAIHSDVWTWQILPYSLEENLRIQFLSVILQRITFLAVYPFVDWGAHSTQWLEMLKKLRLSVLVTHARNHKAMSWHSHTLYLTQLSQMRKLCFGFSSDWRKWTNGPKWSHSGTCISHGLDQGQLTSPGSASHTPLSHAGRLPHNGTETSATVQYLF